MTQEATQIDSSSSSPLVLRREIVETRIFDGVVADEIIASIADSVEEKGHASVALAGGSTPGAVYRALARPPRSKEIPWTSVSLYWGDERWVSHDNQHSNFRMVQETLLSQLKAVSPKVIPVDTSKGSAQESASDYAEKIASEMKLGASAWQSDALPQLDLVLLGIGEDGHFASIFPGSALADQSALDPRVASRESTRWVIPVEHPLDRSPRVSMTPLLLLNARRILLIVKGEAKAEILERLLTSSASPKELPAKLLLTAGPKVTLFCDAAAGKRLQA
jgi:6-phosphogluconolactonase